MQEVVEIVPHNPDWPAVFHREKEHLESCLPAGSIRRIEHFGSTAIPGLAAKPIIDMLVEVVSLDQTKREIVPILESQGYDYFWRPMWSEDAPPSYAWFIKRDAHGVRTHHIHMVERRFPQWDALLFRDYLITHPEVAAAYQELKLRLAAEHPDDRVAYAKAKTEFITAVTERARQARSPSSE
ncbi:MAG: GrpB family protein [Planctomycetaceae bacterium]|nr:GrpB family protein [Planctomycetaceae bacterium]